MRDLTFRHLAFLWSAGALATLSATAATFSPIPLAGNSFTHDIVVERTATPPPPPLTTASMDQGLANTGFGWYEVGFNPGSPTTGLPAAGTTVTSESLANYSFQFAPSYTNNNAVLIDRTTTNATVTFTTPAAFSALSFLASAGNGAVTVGVTVHHADGTTETNSIAASDWFGGTNTAVTANGRLDVGSRAVANVDSGNPRLYSLDVPLTNTSSPVRSVDLKYLSGAGHAGIFALSGSSGAAFTPIAFTGYTVDMVAEAGATAALTSLNATSASLDAGTANTGFSFYEQGYNPAAPQTGLPAAGATVTNGAASDHTYVLPASYATNNAVLIDADNVTATLTPAAPRAVAGLSFLTAAAGGATTIAYTVTHADASTQTGSMVSPDWFNGPSPVVTARGRVDVATAAFDAVNTENPRLYGVDVAVTNSTSPVTAITLAYTSGTGHAVVLAVSGASGVIAPIIDVQPVSASSAAGSAVQLGVAGSGAGPLTYQWQQEVNGTFVNVTDANGFAGSTTTNLTISSVTSAQAGNYRVVVSNSGGATTSQVVRINVLSSATDVTSPADAITSIGGASPAAEVVANAIDDTTAKYLNFGTDNDQAPPFVGPVGLQVTPAVGKTVVTGLRIYTANDAVERDPADYRLEGSNDGTTFTLISSGPLQLPDARNALGQDLDPLTQANEEVTFSNTAGYTTYRLTFTNVKDNAAANSMQVGEIELLGSSGTGTPTSQVGIARGANGTLTITTSQPGTLQSTTQLNGAATVWQTEGPISGSTTVTATGTAKFYRVVPPTPRQQQ